MAGHRTGSSHFGRVSAIAIVGHHQRCARLDLIVDRLVNRHRPAAARQRIARRVLERDGDDRFGIGPRRQNVGRDRQLARQQIGQLHARFKTHRRRADLRRRRVQTEERLDRGHTFGIAGQIGHIRAVERTALHRARLRIKRLLRRLQVERAEARADEHAVFHQAPRIDKRIAVGVLERDQHGHRGDPVDRSFAARHFNRALSQVGIKIPADDLQLRSGSAFDLELAVGNDAQIGGERIHLAHHRPSSGHHGRVSAIAIVENLQPRARLRAVDRAIDGDGSASGGDPRAQRVA